MWRVLAIRPVIGDTLPQAERVAVCRGDEPSPLKSQWTLSGVISNVRYVERPEQQELTLKQAPLGRRYQHASDLRADLKALKRDTDSGRIASSIAPAVREERFRWSQAAIAITVMAILGATVWWARTPVDTIKVVNVIQITRNGLPKLGRRP